MMLSLRDVVTPQIVLAADIKSTTDHDGVRPAVQSRLGNLERTDRAIRLGGRVQKRHDPVLVLEVQTTIGIRDRRRSSSFTGLVFLPANFSSLPLGAPGISAVIKIAINIVTD